MLQSPGWRNCPGTRLVDNGLLLLGALALYRPMAKYIVSGVYVCICIYEVYQGDDEMSYALRQGAQCKT